MRSDDMRLRSYHARTHGKAAIVTGGAHGIGRAIMERLCQEGVSVTFSGISDGGVATEQECKAKGYPVQFVRGDMADEAFCRRLVEDATRHGASRIISSTTPSRSSPRAFDATPRGLAADDERRPDRLRHDGTTRASSR